MYAVAALDIVEDAALAALAPLGPAYIGQAPAGTAGALTTGALSKVFVVQHQDLGGRRRAMVGAETWEGVIVVRCLSASDATARAGRDAAVEALMGMVAATGYVMRSYHDKPIPYMPEAHIYTRAYQIRVKVGKTTA